MVDVGDELSKVVDEDLHEGLVELIVEWLDVGDVYVVIVDESEDDKVVDDVSSHDVVYLLLRTVNDGIEALDEHEDVG